MGANRVITLITDFGNRDGYVGAMKGVILSIATRATVVDITHEIQAGGVAEASFVLESVLPYYPAGTIHLVVVDPAVGSRRRALVLESGGILCVGPDNGVFEAVFRSGKEFDCYELSQPRYHLERVSRTFHGRDIFAPAAAHLASGVKPESLGPAVTDPVRQASLRKKILSRERLVGSVIHVDRFGNLITDLTAGELDNLGPERTRLLVSLCGIQIAGVSEYYSQAPRNELLALVGSTGRLEIAACMAKAVEILGPSAYAAEVTVVKTLK